jgi:nitrite reductase/ring-hydroxylating ferredoxin subunit
MKRNEFLKTLGAGAALAVTFSCLGGCSKSDVSSNEDATSGLPFTVDLSASSSSALMNNGGYIVKNNTVVAKDLNGNYVAATNLCSHEQKRKVIFRNGEYYCTEHGARFNLSGNGLNSDGSGGLSIFNTSLNGTILTVSA